MKDLLFRESSRSSSQKRQVTPNLEVGSQGMRLSPVNNNGISALLEAADILEHSDQPTPISLNTTSASGQGARHQSPLFLPAGWEASSLPTTALSVEGQDSAGERAAAPETATPTIEEESAPRVITFNFPFELVDVEYSSRRKRGPSVSQHLRDLYREALLAKRPNGKLVRLQI